MPGIRRRDVVALIGGAAAMWPFAVRAQQTQMPVVGWLSGQTLNARALPIAAFHQGLNEAGFAESHNAAIEYRWAEALHVEVLDRLTARADEVIE
jgi:hypothetical protein